MFRVGKVFTLAFFTAYSDFALLLRVLDVHGSDSSCDLARTYKLHQLCALCFPAGSHHALIHLNEVILLGAQDGTRSRDSNPPNEGGWRETEVLHAVESNQTARAAQTSLAVDRNTSFFLLCSVEELFNDIVWRRRAIEEVQVEVIHVLLDEFLSVILGFIQANH